MIFGSPRLKGVRLGGSSLWAKLSVPLSLPPELSAKQTVP